MKSQKQFIKRTGVSLLISASVAMMLVSPSWAVPELSIDVSSGVMSALTEPNAVLYVQISGPNGYVKNLQGDEASQWVPDAGDGLYYYDSYSIIETPRGEMTKQEWEGAKQENSSQQSGSFTVESGAIVDPQQYEDEKQSSVGGKSFIEKALISVLDGLVSTASAADLTASSSEPWVTFDDSEVGGIDWRLSGNAESDGSGFFRLLDLNGTNNHQVIDIRSTVGTTTNKNTLTVDTSGGTGLAAYTMFLDRVNKEVGIGTTSPAGTLHLKGSAGPEIILEDIGGVAWELEGESTHIGINANNGANIFDIEQGAGADSLVVDSTSKIGIGTNSPGEDLTIYSPNYVPFGGVFPYSGTSTLRLQSQNGGLLIGPPYTYGIRTWDVNGSSSGFSIENATNNETPFKINNAGKIGMGTTNPLFALHLKRDNASIFVQDTNGATASNVLLELSKNGIPAMRFTNTSNSSSWDMSQRPNKDFVLSRAGSGAFELVIDSVGNMNVRGSVSATSHLTTSARATKTDFEKVDSRDVLSKIKALDVTEWRYKDDKAAKGRHIGPMAEDFYSLFQLGPDNKHVIATDMASIAIVAAKELEKKAEEADVETALLKSETVSLKAETAKLQAENASLQKRLASLEKLVTNLASGQGLLPKSGSRVVLNQLK